MPRAGVARSAPGPLTAFDVVSPEADPGPRLALCPGTSVTANACPRRDTTSPSRARWHTRRVFVDGDDEFWVKENA